MILIRKYYKLLCIQSICIFLLPSCYSPDQILRKQLKTILGYLRLFLILNMKFKSCIPEWILKQEKQKLHFLKPTQAHIFIRQVQLKCPLLFLLLKKFETSETRISNNSGNNHASRIRHHSANRKTSEETVANGSPNIKRYIEKYF